MTASDAFDWADPLLLEAALTDEERMVRDTARAVAASHLAPIVVEANATCTADRGLMRVFGAAGLLGATISGHGCAGVSHVAYGLIAREIERVDSSYRSALSVQSSLVMHPIDAFATDQQKAQYLPLLASGEWIGAFGLTEPDAGSDPAGMRSRARRVPGGFRITGTKTWITSAPFADLFIIWARCEIDGHDNIHGFIVLREDGGISTPEITGKFALRSWPTGQIILDDVFVPEDRLLAVRGLKGPFSCLNKARFGIGWGAMGAAEYCWHAARSYTMERRQFGRPLAATQLVQRKLADMQSEIALGLLLALRCGHMIDRGVLAPETISILKRNNCGKALDIARTARDMHGGNGIADSYGVIRHVLNLEAVNTYEGTHDIHALILGRAQTGIAAF